MAAFLALAAPALAARTAYVTNEGGETVSVIDTATNQVIGAPIKVGNGPREVAITPDGTRAYVTNRVSNDVYVIDTRTNQVLGPPIKVGADPIALAITPDGTHAYVANRVSETVSVIDTATNQLVGAPIKVGGDARGIAITPDGAHAYVTDEADGTVVVIDTRTNQVVGAQIKVGDNPRNITISPDGSRAYVANQQSDTVSVIDTHTNQVLGAPIGVGAAPFGVAIVPDQSPVASFKAARARPGVPTSLDASASSDPDGTIANYAWSFGEGQSISLSAPQTTHTFSAPGAYQVTLSLTDNEGCSAAMIFTGQTAFCHGGAQVQATKRVVVAYPGVRVRCPRAAGPKACSFRLQAIAAKPRHAHRAKAESALARVRVKPGHSAVVSLKPRKAFRAKLAAATRVLVEETVVSGGQRRTRLAKLKIVQ